MSNKPANPPPKQQKSTGAVPVAKAPNAYDRLAAAGGSIAIAGAHVLPSPMSSINNSVTNSSSGALLNRFCAIFARWAALAICLLSLVSAASTVFWPVALRHALSRAQFGLANRVLSDLGALPGHMGALSDTRDNYADDSLWRVAPIHHALRCFFLRPAPLLQSP
ncbi:hypothetical protein FRC08_007710 [Ceratobasidium sp. 394]|nr:hypothetical protein FRC08_007710 [Ceratobasidium sp. 394]